MRKAILNINKSKKLKITGAAILSIGFLFPFANTFAKPVSINDAATHALHSNPQIFERLANIDVSQYLVKQAYSAYFPQVNISAGTGREYLKSANTDFNGATLEESDVSVTAQETIFDAGNRYYTIKERKDNLANSQQRYFEIREAVAFAASNAYLDLLNKRRITSILRKDVNSLQDVLGKVHERLKGGAGRVSEVQLTLSRLAAAKARLQDAIKAMEQAEYTYQQIVGVMPPHNPKDFITPTLPKNLELSITKSIDLAKLHNPILAARRTEIMAALARIRVDQSAFFPTASINTQATHGNNIDGLEGLNNNAFAEVRLNYNIFSGGSDINQMKSDEAQLRSLRYAYYNDLRNITQQIKNSIAVVQNNKKSIVQLRQHVLESFKVFESYQEEFTLGYRTLFDVLNAQREYYNADIALTNAIYERDAAGYQLKALQGLLADYYDTRSGNTLPAMMPID